MKLSERKRGRERWISRRTSRAENECIEKLKRGMPVENLLSIWLRKRWSRCGERDGGRGSVKTRRSTKDERRTYERKALSDVPDLGPTVWRKVSERKPRKGKANSASSEEGEKEGRARTLRPERCLDRRLLHEDKPRQLQRGRHL